MAYNKKRPNSWNPANPAKKSSSISRVKRWKSQQRKRASRSSSVTDKRHTLTTISTLTSSNKNSIQWQANRPEGRHVLRSVFHTQSLLFLFGFLFFPLWWIGGYYIKFSTDDVETMTIVIHPSMIANGKTSSKLYQQPQHKFSKTDPSFDEILFFYTCNRYMSLFSIFLVLLVIAMFIWYLTLI